MINIQKKNLPGSKDGHRERREGRRGRKERGKKECLMFCLAEHDAMYRELYSELYRDLHRESKKKGANKTGSVNRVILIRDGRCVSSETKIGHARVKRWDWITSWISQSRN